ncbi:MAG TPA: hypothetical protein DEP72_08895 [Clostridiales bacterium]|nr:MAG: hypothetical protein A2Y18_03835 [Clostridiales bacterium GWD2_32_19]HCC08256.1 hypothetical protein [Clostridiales bacterium]
MKMFRIFIYAVMMILAFQFNVASAEQGRVVYQINQESKSYIKVELSFIDINSTNKIQITSYKKYNDYTIILTYITGKNAELFDKITINKDELGLKLGNDILPNIILKNEQDGNLYSFKDVGEQYLYRDSILNLYNKGVLNGYPDDTFKPEQAISREEFCQLYIKAIDLKLSDIDVNIFTDVENNRWSKDVINTLSIKGILKGKEAGKFNPTDTITLAEVAAILDRTYTFLNFINRSDYKHTQTNHWANAYITNLLNVNIINEEDSFYKNNSLDKKLTRAESVSIINKVVNGYKTEK